MKYKITAILKNDTDYPVKICSFRKKSMKESDFRFLYKNYEVRDFNCEIVEKSEGWE